MEKIETLSDNLNKLTSMDVLLLVLVKSGLATAYELRSRAGLAGSLTVKPLQKLLKAGFLTKTEGPLNSKRYAISEAGAKKLQATLDSDSENPSWLARYGVFESVPRALFLRWIYPEIGSKHVDWAIDHLRTRAREKKQEVRKYELEFDRFERNKMSGNYGSHLEIHVAPVFQWMKAVSDAALLDAQVEVLEKIVAKIAKRELPPPDSPNT